MKSVKDFLESQHNDTCQKMAKGSDKPVVFMPFLGEYGVFMMHFIRFVHFYQCHYKVVSCRPGDEIYFPSADKFFYDWDDPLPDYMKSGTMCSYNSLSSVHKIHDRLKRLYPGHNVVFSPPSLPFRAVAHLKFDLIPSVERNLKVDVVLGARYRKYKSFRNWQHWDFLSEQLSKSGYTIGCVGKKSTSFQLDYSDVNAWEYNDASANVELLKNCTLYIGSDTGVSHLAAFMDTPTILFQYPNNCCIREMKAANNAYFDHVEGGWYNPKLVLGTALNYLKDRKQAKKKEEEAIKKIEEEIVAPPKEQMPHEVLPPILPSLPTVEEPIKLKPQPMRANRQPYRPTLRGGKS